MKAVLVLTRVALAVPGMLASAFVLLKYWQWFAVPHLHAPALSFSAAIALRLTVSVLFIHQTIELAMLTTKQRESVGGDLSDEAKSVIKDLSIMLVLCPLMLLVGWLWQMGLS